MAIFESLKVSLSPPLSIILLSFELSYYLQKGW